VLATDPAERGGWSIHHCPLSGSGQVV